MNATDLERVRAYVDGELNAEAASQLVRDAQSDAALRHELDSQQSLHSLLRSLPPISAPAIRQPRSRWAAWLGWSSRITLRPAVAALGAVALFLGGIAADRAGRPSSAAIAPMAAAEQVPVRFVFVGQAQKVAVAGSFNHWSEAANPMENAGDGVWEATVLVPKGEHRYQFRVDGQWMADPLAERQAPDGMGHVDSLLQL